jgi:peptidyl-prolyl cis-trans isomerase SurA
MIHRLAAAGLLALALVGCAAPAPLGRANDEPKPPAAATAQEPPLAERSAEPRVAAKPKDEDVTDRVVAVVNNDAITLGELQEALTAYRYQTRQETPVSDEFIKQFLTRMIENRLQVQEAEREKIAVDDAEVEEELTERIKKLDVPSRGGFEKLLKEQGLAMEAIKKRVRDELRVSRVINRKVRLRISVTEAEINTYLTANRQKLETGLAYHARHLLIVPEGGPSDVAWEAARIKAELLRTQLLQGADFAELARQHSRDASAKDGGDLGTLKRGELAQDIEMQILSLEPGAISKPYRSSLGYHLFRLELKESLEGEGLTRAKAQIREILFREKFEARLEAWLKEIKRRAVIEVRL